MRWNSIPPKRGDTRVRSGFLWFPMCVNNEWRWWERADWIEECRYGVFGYCWIEKEWMNP